MQTTLGRKGDYSVRAMLHVARHAGEGRQKAREIADEMEIPSRFVSQILANLVREGFLTAVAGPDGGYQLAREADDITLLEVVEAAEGPIRLERCVLRGGACDWTDVCPVHEAWSRAQSGMIRELEDTSFDHLAGIDAAMVAETYQLPVDTPQHPQPTPRRGASREEGGD